MRLGDTSNTSITSSTASVNHAAWRYKYCNSAPTRPIDPPRPRGNGGRSKSAMRENRQLEFPFFSMDFVDRSALSVGEVAAKLGCSERHVHNLIDEGEPTLRPTADGVCAAFPSKAIATSFCATSPTTSAASSCERFRATLSNCFATTSRKFFQPKTGSTNKFHTKIP